MNTTPKTDEIDLLQLFLRGVRTVRENFWLILAFFVTGTALGFLHYFSSTKIYESKMIVSSYVLTESFTKQIVETLNDQLAEGNIGAVAKQFNVPEATIGSLAHVKIESPYANEGEIAKEADRIVFVITVKVTDKNVLPDLQKGFVYFLENNEYAKERIKLRKQQLKEMVATADKEINDLEKLKGKIYSGEFLQSAKGGIVFDLADINTQIMEIMQLKHTNEEDFYFASSVHVLEGFTIFNRPASPKLSLSLAAGSTVGLIFVGVLLAFKSIRKILAIEEANRRAA